ncbi:DUF1186 domain-containing protein [Endozoicomonas sp.]|uniref:DUF1186 domain-containing protein n=1 Tax=Endozoicomonas sp. TaxID=1892382 RepID=UPI002886149E|nr:DUF1186 domain-containing protein [Endozoicomonas sp.]
MTIDDIINRLSNHVVGELPAETLLAASEQRAELTPRLLDYLEGIAGQGDEIPEGQRVDLVFFAFYLLAQFREQQAFPLMLRVVSASPRVVNRLLGYVVSESLARILASVIVGQGSEESGDGGKVEPLKQLIENEAIHPYVRYSCLTCLSILVFYGFLPREQLGSYFQQLFHGGLERQRSPVWDGLVSNSIVAGFVELETDIIRTFDDELLVDSFMGKDRLRAMLQEHPDDIRFPPYENFALIDDSVAELEGWASFNSSQPQKERTERVPVGRSAELEDIQRVKRPWPARKPKPGARKPASSNRQSGQQMLLRSSSPGKNQQPVVRPDSKVGRNDPCPCGSGRKFKKCCG